MRSYRLEGIVIKRINFKEADRIIIFFSKELGKIKILGKGIRKITSRRAPHLEIFSHVKVFVHEAKFFPYITEAQVIYGFGRLRKNFRKVAIAYHLCEIADRMLPEREKNASVIFNSFVDTLHLLEDNHDSTEIRSSVRMFVHSLLYKLGFLPPNKVLTYSQLISEIESIVERPLSTLRLLTKISRNLQ